MGRKRSANEPVQVHCDEHGATEACILCRHLRLGRGLRYYAIKGDPWAWCAECDSVLEAEQGWSDRLYQFADWQVYCRQCFRRALRRHKLVEWVVFEEADDDE
jgi:hypothetical protein